MFTDRTHGRRLSAASAEPRSDPAAIQLAELADEVLREVTELKRLYEELERVVQPIELTGPTAGGSHIAEEESPVAAQADDRESRSELSAVRRIASAAALSGASRHEVEVYLREELGVEDSAAALDEVFGDEAASKRWP